MKATRRKAALIAQLAWIATFVAPLALTALLLGAPAANAASPPPAAHSYPTFEDEEDTEEDTEEEELGAEEELDWEAEGWEEEELGGTDCELGEEALAEGQLTVTDVEELCAAEEEWEAELEGRSLEGPSARPSCALRSARARVVTRRNRLKLTIGYMSTTSTKATIEVRTNSGQFVSVRRHIGGSGVVRITRRLGKERPGRVKVRLKAPPCKGFQTRSAKVR